MSFTHRSPVIFLASILLLFLSGCVAARSEPVPASLDAAENAYFQLDVRRTIDIYERLLLDPVAPKEDRSRALRNLARIEWKFHKDVDQARHLLSKALLPGENLFEAYGYLSRIEMEAGNHPAPGWHSATPFSTATWATPRATGRRICVWWRRWSSG